MSFDPDKYLAEKASPAPAAFNPDQYLAEKTGSAAPEEPGLGSGDFHSTNPLSALAGLFGGSTEAVGQKAADAATLGHLPQIVGAANKVGGGDYLSARDAEIQKLEDLAKNNPKSSATGTVAGMAATIPAAEAMAAAGPAALNATKLRTAMTMGGELGALSNPGDKVGEVNPTQLWDRTKNSAIGTLAGGALHTGVDFVGNLPSKLSSMGSGLEDLAEKNALRSAGAQKPQMKALNNSGRTNDVGRFIIDEGIVKPGDGAQEIYDKVHAVKQDAGNQIGQVFDEIGKTGKAGTFNRKEVATAMREALAGDSNVAGSLDSDEVMGKLEKYISNFEGKKGPASAKELLDLKGQFDGRINYSKGAQDLPELQQGYKNLRSTVSEAINNRAEALSNEVRGDLGQRLKDANRRYGLASSAADLAKNKLNQDGNKFFSLTDSIAGAAGGAAGFAHGGVGAIPGAMLAASANKALRHYGPAVGTAVLDSAGGALSGAGEALASRFGGMAAPDAAALRIAALEQVPEFSGRKQLRGQQMRNRLKAMGE